MIHLEPATPTDRIKNREEADFLIAHPGEWFKVRTSATQDAAWSFAHQITIGRKAAFRPKGAFEGRTVGLDVLARYVGEDL